MSKTAKILVAIAIAIIAVGIFLGGFFAGRAKRKPVVQRDTVTTIVTFRDTITVYQPKYITKEVIRLDTVLVSKNDTTYITVPIERREYRDSNYYAVVSGYKPSLDEISVFPETKVVTQTVTVTEKRNPTRFGIGFQVGFGGVYGMTSKRFDAGPYIGIGLSYNVARF